ncbi:hypothetical protein BpHYR1_036629 [Brachionus plicatilis]|uniref:Uncharacterized protein n=1 Tax=Brachionus plicatilis TaxID=10195 RepID=A0A3M7Q3G7_BRAPC|nr:hypothetical protein BpHYR1_036629 [Brachionus plicatilis]
MHGLKPEFWFLVHASLCKASWVNSTKRFDVFDFKEAFSRHFSSRIVLLINNQKKWISQFSLNKLVSS